MRDNPTKNSIRDSGKEVEPNPLQTRTFQGENTFGWITPAPGAMKRAEQARDYSQGWDGSQENRTRKLREKFRKE
jgi:hypothetical protein